jgi:2-polyprenyl-3-methyl-5-hydroxy-6-metoxy-1,4-benzoquinol methylase
MKADAADATDNVDLPSSSYYQFEDINHAVIRLLVDARKMVHEPERVLDLGCGRARLGLEIERLGYVVTGIESSPIACATARTRIGEVLELDLLDTAMVSAALRGRQFEWLLAADVLEHSPDPWATLAFYRDFLKPNGRLIMSLPNVAVWDNRLRMLFGRFSYQDSGVMDRTHLRFFTFRSARELVNAAGFVPLLTTLEPGIARAFLPLLKRTHKKENPSSIVDSPAYRLYTRRIMPLETLICRLAPGLLAFRVVILARSAVP